MSGELSPRASKWPYLHAVPKWGKRWVCLKIKVYNRHPLVLIHWNGTFSKCGFEGSQKLLWYHPCWPTPSQLNQNLLIRVFQYHWRSAMTKACSLRASWEQIINVHACQCNQYQRYHHQQSTNKLPTGSCPALLLPHAGGFGSRQGHIEVLRRELGKEVLYLGRCLIDRWYTW